MATGSAPPESERGLHSAIGSDDAGDAPLRVGGAGRILTNTFYRGIADVGSKVVSVAFFIAMARLLGNAAFGVFTFGLAYAAIVTVLAGFGQDAVLTRAVARERHRVHEYFANTVALKLLVAVPVLALVALIEWVAGVDATTRSASLLLALGVLAELLAGTCFAVFQAYERLGFMPVVIISQRLATAGVGVTAMLLGAKVVAVCAIYLAAATAAFVLALVLMARAVVRPAATIDVHRWLPLMRAAFPVGVALVLQVVLFRVDAAILKLLVPLGVVGDYGAAYRLFESTLFLGWAVGAAIYPVLARVAGDRWATRMVFERSLKLVLAFTVPAAVAAAVLARPLVELLYGSDFAASARPLQILAPTIVLASLNHIAGVLLLAENRQRYIAIVYGALAVENIAANFALIPWLSLNGAALNTTLTEILLVCALVGYSFRLTAAPDWLRLLSGPTLGGAVGAAAMLALRAHVVPAMIVGLLAYAGVLAAFERLAYPDDARTVWRFVRRRADAVPT